MKLLVLTSTYPRGPTDTLPAFVHQLCRGLVEAGHSVVVLTPRLQGGTRRQCLDGVEVRRFRYCLARWETLTGAGGIVERLRARPWRLALVPLFLAGFALAIARALRERYDIVHAHWLIPQGLVAALVVPALSGTPLVCTAHGSDIQSLRGKLFARLRKWVAHRARITCVVSAPLRELLIEEGVPSARIAVASMGVDLAHRFVPDERIRRDPAGLIYVGRLVKGKGVHVLLEAFARALRTRADATLVLVGDGPERPRLEAMCGELGITERVCFLGARPQSELPALYSAAAIAVVPSLAEGFGLVAVEAMGCGCTVIASDLPALRALVKPGETGMLVPPNDVSGLTHAIEQALSAPGHCATMAARGRESVLERHGWPAVVSCHEAIYDAARQPFDWLTAR